MASTVEQMENQIEMKEEPKEVSSDEENDDIGEVVDFLYKPNPDKIKISSDDRTAKLQFMEILQVQTGIMEGKCNAFDALSVLTGFLLAFAFGDTVNMEIDAFNSPAMFLIYAICLMSTVLFGTFSLVTLSFICIRLRRQLSRDAAAPTWFADYKLHWLREVKTASVARMWYYGGYYRDPNDKAKIEKHEQMKKKCLYYTPCHMVKKGVSAFLLMIIFYVGSMYISVFDTFYGFFDADDDEMFELFMVAPVLWTIVSIFVYIFLMRWLWNTGAIHDVA